METIISKEVIKTLLIIGGTFLFYIIFKYIMLNTLLKKARKKSNKKALTTITVAVNIVKYMLYIAVILMILDVWGIDTKALLTSLGIVGIIVGLALQDLLKDIIGGTSILMEDQFKVGDNIKIGEFRGEVISLGLKTTKIRAYTGEVKIIANRNITEVTNYSIKNSKCIIKVPISYEYDIDEIKIIIEKICKKLKDNTQCTHIEMLGIDELLNEEYIFKILAETKPNEDVKFKRIALEEIVREFKEQNIKIPVPKVEIKNEKRI